MEQREHAGLEYFARLKNLSTPESGANLSKRANEATGVLRFFTIAAEGRMSEKNPALLVNLDHNGTGYDV
jgi:hypothetical protein